MKKLFLFFVMVLIGFSVGAQITTLTFSGKDANNNYVRLDSVFITNHTKSWQETIYYPDTILIMGGSGIENYGTNPSFTLSQNIPNPFSGVSDFSLQLPEENAVTIAVFDLNGRKITEIEQNLSRGIHLFRVYLSTPQAYLLSVNGGKKHASIKIINTGNAGKNRIEYISLENEMPVTYQLKLDKGETQNPFDLGDSMEYMGYATINGEGVESQVVSQLQDSSESFDLIFTIVWDGQPCPGTPTLTDVDGNIYNTVQIGNQCWMKENLRTTKYDNNTTIPMGDSASNSIAYRYYPNNNSSNVPIYGYLYNWVAIMNGSGSSNANPSGVQGICPTGWHVPSDAEWEQLVLYLMGESQYLCGGNIGFFAKALASQDGWISSTHTCAVGNTPSTNNSTGFSALPTGYYDGNYGFFGSITNIWSATIDNLNNLPLSFYLGSDEASVFMSIFAPYGEEANVVRCVRD